MATKTTDGRFFAGEGFTKEAIAAELEELLFDCLPEEGVKFDQLTEDHRENILGVIESKLTDELCGNYVDFHAANLENYAGGDYGEDQFLENETEIDFGILSEIGFHPEPGA